MNIPKQIKIGCYDYDIKFLDGKSEEMNFGESWGKVNSGDLTIKIVDGLKPQLQEEILMHEILHASLDYMEMEHDEELVQKLSKVLYQVFEDNKLY